MGSRVTHTLVSETGHAIDFVFDGDRIISVGSLPAEIPELVFARGVPPHAQIDAPDHVVSWAQERGMVVCYYDPNGCRTCYCDDAGHMRCVGMC